MGPYKSYVELDCGSILGWRYKGRVRLYFGSILGFGFPMGPCHGPCWNLGTSFGAHTKMYGVGYSTVSMGMRPSPSALSCGTQVLTFKISPTRGP